MTTRASAYRGRLIRLRRNPMLLGLAAGIGLLTPWVPPALFLAAVAMALVWSWNPAKLRHRVTVKADARGLELGGQRVPRAALKDGFVIPKAKRPIVLLRRRRLGGSISLEVDEIAEGRRVLAALGLDAAQSVARITGRALPLAKTWFHLVLVACVPFVVLGFQALDSTNGLGFLRFSPLLVLAAIFAAALVPSTLAIGTDGLEVRWLGQRRFVRYADVVHVGRFVSGFGNSQTAGVEILLEGGETLRVPLASRRSSDASVAMALERVSEAMEAYERGGAPIEATVLARGARDVGAWVRALRGIGAGANASMREAPVARDRLWRVVEDPKIAPRERAAAAVALGGDVDAEGKERLRAAAEGVALPKLRVAIEVAASDDEAAMSQALEELEADEGDPESAREQGDA